VDSGELLTRWSVRLAVALYVLALTLRISARGREAWQAWARLFWTGGCLAFLLHMAFAFQFYHHWSNNAAYEATARQTAEVVGLDWGGGLYANYAFAIVWSIDAGCWWCGLRRYEVRSRIAEWLIQGYLAFIIFNATVVFGTEAIRWLGVAAYLILASLFLTTKATAK